jgi:hypothetical protein
MVFCVHATPTAYAPCPSLPETRARQQREACRRAYTVPRAHRCLMLRRYLRESGAAQALCSCLPGRQRLTGPEHSERHSRLRLSHGVRRSSELGPGLAPWPLSNRVRIAHSR